MHRRTDWILIASVVLLGGSCGGGGEAPDSLAYAPPGWVVVIPPDAATPVAKAADMLSEEVFKRTGEALEVLTAMPALHTRAIVLGATAALPPGMPEPPAGLAVPPEAEGYAVWTDSAGRQAPTVCVLGRDDRGVVYGAGALLRALRMRPGEFALDPGFRASTAPAYPVRGHELGYRHTSNTYDAWSVDQFEQYIRDLAVFGANGVQLIVQLDSLDIDGPHMTEPVLERTAKLVRMIGEYGMRVWVWMPPSEHAITPETAPAVLEKCRAFFEQCSPLDAIFVPGGDPGDTPPEVLLPLLKDVAALLRVSHPNAEIWFSNEDMPHEWNATLFEMLSGDPPDWLTGVVFGTWVKMPLATMRARVPEQYLIVQYCDITHCIECQYPVPDWDHAFASTLGREPINPRPVATAHIFDVTAPHTIGFNTYSDGVNDDVNKIIWSAKGWDPQADVGQILIEYGRYFMGEDLGGKAAEGLLALEQNWQGPLLSNEAVEDTLALWQEIEQEAGTTVETNWRLQMGLLRAYYDAYLRRKLVAETEREQRACAELARVPEVDVATAIGSASAILAEADAKPDAPELRARIEELGGFLFKSIGMQLSVDTYGAKNWERGAILDALDMPLSDRLWYESQFKEILALADEPSRAARLHTVVNWEDAGPGGFYDDLGNAWKQPHLVRQKDWAADPSAVESTQCEVIEVKGREAWRRSWRDQGQTLFGTPLHMRYEGLDTQASYTVRVVYTGRFRPTMRLVANGTHEIHGPMPQPEAPVPLEFAVPKEATAGGTLDLEWHHFSGRGCQVAEVWLLRPDG